MRTFTGLVVAALLVTAVPAFAQTAESQPTYRWLATPCDTWGCAIAAMAEGKGDPFVIALPTKSTAHPWIVLKRVPAGMIEGPIDPLFAVEGFSGMGEASARFSSFDSEQLPMLVTTTDGGMLVICKCGEEPSKKRAVRTR